MPVVLGGTTIKVNGEPAGLIFVSPLQVNFVIPTDTQIGTANVQIISGEGIESNGTVKINFISPALFTANADGEGPVAANVVRVRDGVRLPDESVVQFDSLTGQYLTKPIDLGPPTDRVFLELYGTGLRRARDVNNDGNKSESYYVVLGGKLISPSYAGAQAQFAGLDQLNFEIPRDLIGAGKINLAVTAITSSPFATNATSKVIELEIASPSAALPPVISDFTPKLVTVGDNLTINGNGFSSLPAENTVRIGGVKAKVETATATQIVARVPYAAMSGKVTVKTGQGEGSSAERISVKTSLSGIVETDMYSHPLDYAPSVANVTVRLFDTPYSTTTNSYGAFLLADIPAGDYTLEFDPNLPRTSQTIRKGRMRIKVRAGRDNQLSCIPRLWEGSPDAAIAQLTCDNGLGGVSGYVADSAYGVYGRTSYGTLTEADGKTPLEGAYVSLSGPKSFNSSNSHMGKTDAAGGLIFRSHNFQQREVSSTLIIKSLDADGTVKQLVNTNFHPPEEYFTNQTRPVFLPALSFSNPSSAIAPPLILIPDNLYGQVNVPKEVDFVVLQSGPEPIQQLAVTGISFGTIIPKGGNLYTLRLTPKEADYVRNSRLTVEATDSQGRTGSVWVDLELILQNTAPTVTVPGDQTVKAGETLNFTVSVAEPDGGQIITLVASDLPSGASFVTPYFPGRFSWTPTAAQVGTYTVKFTATDDGVPPLSDTKTVKITVK